MRRAKKNECRQELAGVDQTYPRRQRRFPRDGSSGRSQLLRTATGIA